MCSASPIVIVADPRATHRATCAPFTRRQVRCDGSAASARRRGRADAAPEARSRQADGTSPTVAANARANPVAVRYPTARATADTSAPSLSMRAAIEMRVARTHSRTPRPVSETNLRCRVRSLQPSAAASSASACNTAGAFRTRVARRIAGSEDGIGGGSHASAGAGSACHPKGAPSAPSR
jgi:hypothetical protein